ncbi:MAG: hypothetical protein II685_06630 [Clostridia bacterium]|nr:hypothetical protein [Clostridia bacterium]
MDKKNDIILSVVGLAIVVIGVVVLLILKFYLGLILVLPTAIPHILRLTKLGDKGDKE